MFGLTGDLGEKKLFPAIVELVNAGQLDGKVIAIGRSDVSDDELWQMLADSTGATRDELSDRLDLQYLRGDSQDTSTYTDLAERLGEATDPVVYAALPPHLFRGVAEGLAAAGIDQGVRLVVEKPFGSDAASARELYDDITSVLDPSQLFPVDHFLAKATVENLQTFRSANPAIDAMMRTGTAQRIEITMAEAFGVDGRGSFYDNVGAIDDVVQNHLLQLIAVLLMETPTDQSAEAFDRARADLLGSIAPITDAVLGQFEGYTDVDDVDAESTTETFVAARLEVECERWRGVEVVLRTGKELADSYTEAVVVFADQPANRLRFSIKPEPTIALEVVVLDPDGHDLRPVTMWACGPTGHGGLSDYATMLAGALSCDHRHFARIDDIEAAWRIVAPLHERPSVPVSYKPSSMGPEEADRLLSTGRWIPPLPGVGRC